MLNSWYIIINPTSGNGAAVKKWNKIKAYLAQFNVSFVHSFSSYSKHEEILVAEALKIGHRKIISVGGDGTLHHIINGIMTQKNAAISEIIVAVIPIGTGNDWVKTYKIPKNIKEAVSIISKENSEIQDIGLLELSNTKERVYFNNLAGLGFDGFVVKNVERFKKFGALSYLLGSITGFLHYKKISLEIEFNNKTIHTKCLLTLIGICNYSGGGMRLTKNTNPKDGLFDISIAKNFTLFTILLNILKFYNGSIVKHKEVDTYKTSNITIKTNDKNAFVQADGELLGQGGFKAQIIPQSIRFVIP